MNFWIFLPSLSLLLESRDAQLATKTKYVGLLIEGETEVHTLVLTFLVADTRLYTLPCRSVGRSVRPSVTFLNSERFSHYCSCPTVRDWIAVYPALF